MAKLSSDGKYVTVEKGDTLWSIAAKHLGSGSKYQELASINKISNPNRIAVGQKIYLSKSSASGSTSSSSSSSKSNSNQVSITAFGLQSNTDNTLFVTWTWSKSNTASYLVEWTYDTGNSVWFIGSNSTNSVDKNNTAAALQSTYSIPSNAVKVRVRIKPISETYTKNDKETNYWTASWSSYKTYTDSTPLATPATPSVEIKEYNLTAKLENIEVDATSIEFQIYKNDGSSAYKTGKATITATKSASYSCTVDAGGEYKVRCRAVKGSSVSEWSQFSSGSKTIPAASSGITSIKANSETSVYLEWTAADTAETYDIEYTTKLTNFDITDQTTTKTGIKTTQYEVTGLETGEEYFFRVRAVNEKGESAWSEAQSVKIGKKPTAPTTWSSTTTCITGEELTLYWVHNAEDGSSQTYAELELTIGGVFESHTIKNSTDEEEKDKTSVYTIDTTGYKEGTKIQWRVRTAGVTLEYGEWSIERTVDIYAPPTLELNVTDASGNAVEVLTSFPFYVYGLPGPNTQTPNSYHLSIVANESYEAIDNVGNTKYVNQGEEVYSQYFDIVSSLEVELLPHNVDLENNVSYTITCTVSMNSGLTAEESRTFTVSWTDEIYQPNAEISYDPERYVTHIRPYCMEYQVKYYKVEWSSNTYSKTTESVDDTTLDSVYTSTGELVSVGVLPNGLEIYYSTVYVDQNGDPIDPTTYIVNYSSGVYTISHTIIDATTIANVYTSTGEEVLMGINGSGDEIRYCVTEGTTLVENVTLSVYRREYDGKFVEIATGLNNTDNTYVTDPHPALDYARYRVVAISDLTGAVSFYDVPGYPIGEVGAIIQWDEAWSNFDTSEESELVQPPWTGSLLKLPYNVDMTENNSPDVVKVAYIGRSHPVSYYGTQLGTAFSLSLDIDKNDNETLYALRRLMNWMGDAYVRTQTGVGYWANVKVSFSRNHGEVIIPVSIEVTRVEGGV